MSYSSKGHAQLLQPQVLFGGRASHWLHTTEQDGDVSRPIPSHRDHTSRPASNARDPISQALPTPGCPIWARRSAGGSCCRTGFPAPCPHWKYASKRGGAGGEMFLITNSAGCSCCLCFPTTGYKMDNGEEHELQCLNPDLLSQAAENPPLPGLFSDYRSSNLPCTQLHGRCVTILFNSAQGPDANRSSSAHTQLCLEDEDFCTQLFVLLRLFAPNWGLVFRQIPPWQSKTRATTVSSLVPSLPALQCFTANSSKKTASNLRYSTAAFSPPSRRSSPSPLVIG